MAAVTSQVAGTGRSAGAVTTGTSVGAGEAAGVAAGRSQVAGTGRSDVAVTTGTTEGTGGEAGVVAMTGSGTTGVNFCFLGEWYGQRNAVQCGVWSVYKDLKCKHTHVQLRCATACHTHLVFRKVDGGRHHRSHGNSRGGRLSGLRRREVGGGCSGGGRRCHVSKFKYLEKGCL